MGEKTTHIDKAKSKRNKMQKCHDCATTITVQQLLVRLTDYRKPFAGVVIFDIMFVKKGAMDALRRLKSSKWKASHEA